MAMTTRSRKGFEKRLSAAAEERSGERVGTQEKIFLLRIPHQLYELTKEKAACRKMPVHDFIVTIIEKASRRK